MTNHAVARVFQAIGDLMEIRGDNPFKVRAYRQAARTLEDMVEPVEILAERGELSGIPGFGEAILAKTADILRTGTCDLYESLKEEMPGTLPTLLALPGIGAKKVLAIWRETGVSTIDELEVAAKAGRLAGLPGMGSRTEAALLEAIPALRRRTARIPIGTALPYAEALRRDLLAGGVLQRVEFTGSLRRRRDTVGDIDLLAECADVEAGLDVLAHSQETTKVLAREGNRIEVMTAAGIRAELRVVPAAAFGTAWVVGSGTAEHVKKLSALGPLPEVATEEAVYAAVGLPAIPVELRVGADELEAARTGALPVLIEPGDLRGILHAHTNWSDGFGTISQMADAARRLGFAYHAVTDHSRALAVARGLDEARLREQMLAIDQLNQSAPDGFRILKGIECDILPDGSLDLPLDLLNELDVVVASVHLQQRMDEETMTDRILRAIESGVVDILGHPTGRLLGMRDPYAVDMERVMQAAVRQQVCMEINAAHERLDLSSVHAALARRHGLLLAINTDAHHPDHLGAVALGVSQARNAGLRAEDVLNTWPLDRLLGWLHGRK